MRKQQIRRAASLALCLLLCAACLMQGAAAAKVPEKTLTSAQIRESCTFTIRFGRPNVDFELYRIASVGTDVRFTVTPAVESSLGGEIDVAALIAAGDWTKLTNTLLPYTSRLEVFRGATTDSRGEAVFTGVPTGLYLVRGGVFSQRDEEGVLHHYEPLSYMLCLPDWDVDARDWSFHVTAPTAAKVAELPADLVWLRVKKDWRDQNNADGLRPRSVTIELLQDGRVLEEISLDKGNNWTYTWKDLEPGHSYQVREKTVPGGYTVSYSPDGGVIIVQNDHRPDTPGPSDPSDPSEPSEPDVPLDDPEVPKTDLPSVDPEDPRGDPEDPGEEIEIEDEEIPLSDLPQTGQLWWPVPLLAMAGMFLILLGWGRRRGSESDEE